MSSSLAVEQLLIGVPGDDTLTVRWWLPLGVATDGPTWPRLDEHMLKRAFWVLEPAGASFRMVVPPVWLQAVTRELLQESIDQLNRAPREWRKHLTWREILEHDRPVLAIRNFLQHEMETK